jgi:hypothetical protein
MKPLRKGPSPALIVAVAAMAFALVGTAVAANDGTIYPKLSKSKVKKIAQKQAKKQLKANVNNSHVNLADLATNAENLGGSPASDYQKKGLKPFTAIGTFNNNWSRFSNNFSEPGYWVDEDGVVNIQGGLHNGTSSSAFTLPPEVRPQTFRSYVIRCAGGVGHVELNPTGNFAIFSIAPANCATYAFIDGITYRPDN